MSTVGRAWLTAAALTVVVLLVLGGALLPGPGGGRLGPRTHSPVPSTASAARPLVSPVPLSAPQPIGGRLFNSTTGPPAGSANSVTGVAIDPSTGEVFAANEFAGSVTEFGESNGTLLNAVTVGVFVQGTFPAGLALDPAGHQVFVSISTAYSGARASGWLLVLDESGLGTVANISFASAPITPFEPTYLAFDAPTHQLFVENQSWGYLAVVNLLTDSVTGYLACPVISCAYHGYGLLDVPQYHTLVIPTCARQLWFVNTTNDSTRGLVTGPPNSLMAWAAYDSLDDALWVENYTFSGAAGSFFRMNLTTLAIESNVPGAPPRGTDLSYDGAENLLVATNINGSLAIATYYASNATAIASYSQGVAGSHPFYTIAIDPTTGTAIGAGLGDGSTVAFSLPSLQVELVYPSFPSSQPAVAIDPTSSTYFVAGNSPPTVRAVAEATGSVAWSTAFAEGTPGSQFVAIAADPSIDTVFVADAGLHQVRSLNASSGALLLSGALPGAPTQCALLVDPVSGDLVVGTTSPSQLLELDPSTLSVLATLALPGSTPCALAFDAPAGDILALSTALGANVTAVNAATFSVGSSWTVGSDASGIAVNATGVAFLLEGGAVASLNVSTGESAPSAIASIGGPGSSIASDNADGLLFVGLSSAPAIAVASTSSGTVVGELAPAQPVGCLSFDPTSAALVAPSALSGDVFTSTLVPVPGMPASLTANAGNGTAWLNWTAPLVSGPYLTDGYMVAAHPVSSPGGVPRQNVTGTSTTIVGLTDGVTYQLEVFARSAAGVGLAPAVANVTPQGLPYPPAAVLLVATGPTTAELVWAAPDQDGGSPITAYTVHYGAAGSTPSAVPAGNGTNLTLTGLSASTQYEAWVTATNGVGVGNPSEVAVGSTPAAPAPSTIGTDTNLLLVAGASVAAAAVTGVVLGRWSRGPGRPPEPGTGPAILDPPSGGS